MNPDPDVNQVKDPSNNPVPGRKSSDWDVRNGPRNYASLAATQVGGALLSFASVWLITRYMGSAGYGGVVALIAASQLAQILVNWTVTAVIRFGVAEFIEAETIARTFWSRLIILAVNFGLVMAFATFWFPPLSDWLKLAPETFWLVIAHFALTALWVHVQYGLQGIKMLPLHGLMLMLDRLLTLTGLVIFVVLGKLEFFTAAVCYIVSPAIMILIGIIPLRKYIFSRFTVDREFFKKIVVYSVPLFPLSFLGYLAGGYLDAAFISKYLSVRDLGTYALATQIGGIALQFPTLLNSLLLPFFITKQQEAPEHQTVRFFKDTLPVMVLLWGLGCSLACFCGYFLIPRIFGADFQLSILPLWILLTTSSFIVPVLAGYGAIVSAKSKTYVTLVAGIFAAVTNVSLNIILIPRWGAAGCAWSTAATYLISTAIHAILLRKITKLTISWIFVALTPSLACATGFTVLGNPWEAFAICVGVSSFILYFKRESFFEFFKHISAFRYRSVGE